MRNSGLFSMSVMLMLMTTNAAGAQDFPPVESELDRLSKSAENSFPDLEIEETRKPVSVTIRAQNKITARFIDIEADMEKVVKFGTLEIVPRFCDKRPPEEFPETTAFLQVYDRGIEKKPDDLDETKEQVNDAAPKVETRSTDSMLEVPDQIAPWPTVDGEDLLGDISDGLKIFSGWMFASSPALNPLEHSVYDIWLIDCKTVAVDQ